MVDIASRFLVGEDELEAKAAEMIDASVYYTAAAQHPPQRVRIDFYFMHCANSSVFLPSFLAAPWLSARNKARLLELKAYTDLAMYASRRAPQLLPAELTDYTVLHAKSKSLASSSSSSSSPAESDNPDSSPPDAQWRALFARMNAFDDDGHAAKLVRAVAHGARYCEPYEGREGFRLSQKDWLTVGHMAVDSVEDAMAESPHALWGRSVGFEEAWKGIPEREGGRASL